MSDEHPVPPFIEKLARELCRERMIQGVGHLYTEEDVPAMVDLHWRSYVEEAKTEFANRLRTWSAP